MNAYEKLRHELENYLSYLDKAEIDKLLKDTDNYLESIK